MPKTIKQQLIEAKQAFDNSQESDFETFVANRFNVPVKEFVGSERNADLRSKSAAQAKSRFDRRAEARKKKKGKR